MKRVYLEPGCQQQQCIALNVCRNILKLVCCISHSKMIANAYLLHLFSRSSLEKYIITANMFCACRCGSFGTQLEFGLLAASPFLKLWKLGNCSPFNLNSTIVNFKTGMWVRNFGHLLRKQAMFSSSAKLVANFSAVHAYNRQGLLFHCLCLNLKENIQS